MAGNQKAWVAHWALILPARSPKHCHGQNDQRGDFRDRPAESKGEPESRLVKGRKGNLSSPEGVWKPAVEDYFVRAMVTWVGPKNPDFSCLVALQTWSHLLVPVASGEDLRKANS